MPPRITPEREAVRPPASPLAREALGGLSIAGEAADGLPFLGHGAQYNVYDLGNGRVRKVPMTYDDTAKIMDRWGVYKHAPDKAAKHAASVGVLREESIGHVSDMIRKAPESAKWLGNPAFYPNGNYDQDKIVTIWDTLKRANTAGAEDLVRKYVRTQLVLWRYGVSDTVYKFGSNNGINTDNQVIQIDFGELTSDKASVRRHIEQQSWHRSPDLSRLAKRAPHLPNLKNYFLKVADQEWTLDNLKRYWDKRP